jgi:hypothetical protein
VDAVVADMEARQMAVMRHDSLTRTGDTRYGGGSAASPGIRSTSQTGMRAALRRRPETSESRTGLRPSPETH